MKRAKKYLLGALLLAIACVACEQILEYRDAAAFTVHDTFASVNGKRVRYLLQGKGQPGPTIVLIPGLTACIEQWEDVQALLSEHAPSLAYDRAGMGFSEATNAHDAATEADELAGLLRATGTSSKVLVVSFSSSALVARVFAAKYQDMLGGLVFVDPALPEIRALRHDKSYRRIFAQPFAQQTLKALFGIARFNFFRRHLKIPETTSAQRYSRVINSSFHHWFAAAQDALALDRSSEQATAAPGFGALPVGVFCTFPKDAEDELSPLTGMKALAARLTRGIYRHADNLDHETFLNFRESSKPAAAFVLELENQLRAQ